MWVRCNPNPVGRETGDCVIRAIAVVTGQSWRAAYWDLCEQGAVMGDLPNSNAQFLLPESCPSCITVRAFCERYPEGVYVIGTGDHAIAIIDGDWYDLADSGLVTPTYFWKVK